MVCSIFDEKGSESLCYLCFSFFFFQGMNEIIGPLYYVFCSDPNPEWQGQ